MPPPGYGPPPGGRGGAGGDGPDWGNSAGARTKAEEGGEAAEEDDDDGAPPGIDEGPPGTKTAPRVGKAAPVKPGKEEGGGEEAGEKDGWADELVAGCKVWFCARSGAAAVELELVRVVRAGEGKEAQGDAASEGGEGGAEGGGAGGEKGAVVELTVRDGKEPDLALPECFLGPS